MTRPAHASRRGKSAHRRDMSGLKTMRRCGARTRAGTPCRAPVVTDGVRCCVHGGQRSGAPPPAMPMPGRMAPIRAPNGPAVVCSILKWNGWTPFCTAWRISFVARKGRMPTPKCGIGIRCMGLISGKRKPERGSRPSCRMPRPATMRVLKVVPDPKHLNLARRRPNRHMKFVDAAIGSTVVNNGPSTACLVAGRRVE